MSIEQLGEKEFARRNLWEATLFDENHNPLIWSTGLIKSINIPKLQFTIEDIFAGTSKGYLGWKLPDNLSVSIWETSDHQVEKYLDEWMLGKTGVFNPESGAFRVQPSEDYLYRDVKIKTFIYEYIESKPYRVKKENTAVELASGESVYAKQWRAVEKTTSLITYSTAIEGYDIGTYDYTTGDGVSYTVNLAVRDFKIEYPV
jgi:hypothetical protein